jgi:hypothetical protein
METIGRFEGEYVVSTVRPFDYISGKDYETAILDERYSDSFIVVETYTNKEDAKKGHEKWIEIMKNPPETLTDVGGGITGTWRNNLIGTPTYKRK